jgi:hypothetical protein
MGMAWWIATSSNTISYYYTYFEYDYPSEYSACVADIQVCTPTRRDAMPSRVHYYRYIDAYTDCVIQYIIIIET